MRNFLDWLFIGFMGTAALFFLFGGVFQVIVSGDSMFPTYKNGDTVVALKSDSYAVNDIVIYDSPDENCVKCTIIHRIVEDDPKLGFIIQGDNNPHADPWHPTSEEIKGKAILHLPFGEIGFVLFNPYIWRFTFLLTAVVAAIDWFLYTRRQSKNDEEEQNDESARNFNRRLFYPSLILSIFGLLTFIDLAVDHFTG